MSLQEKLDEVDAVIKAIGGCGDGFCYYGGKAKGQHTNGGCRCPKDHRTKQLLLAFHRLRNAVEEHLKG